MDPYGNYVIRHILEHGNPDHKKFRPQLAGITVGLPDSNFGRSVVKMLYPLYDHLHLPCNIVSDYSGVCALRSIVNEVSNYVGSPISSLQEPFLCGQSQSNNLRSFFLQTRTDCSCLFEQKNIKKTMFFWLIFV